jgi:hypothetical protein
MFASLKIIFTAFIEISRFVEFAHKILYINKSIWYEMFFLWQILSESGKNMNQNCQHCGTWIVGDVYRVTSEYEGTTLLDMIVCFPCSMEAKKLGLHTEELKVRSKEVSARNGASHRLRLGI